MRRFPLDDHRKTEDGRQHAVDGEAAVSWLSPSIGEQKADIGQSQRARYPLHPGPSVHGQHGRAARQQKNARERHAIQRKFPAYVGAIARLQDCRSNADDAADQPCVAHIGF